MLGFAATLLGAPLAHANIEIARMNGIGSCSTCHSESRSPTKATLNPLGLKYLECNLNQACWDRLNAAVRTLELSPSGQPAGTPAPQRSAAPSQPPPYTPPAAAAPTAAGLPPGSYQSRCRSLEARQDAIFGACANGRNETVHTTMRGFQDCQSDIAVDADGYLVCNLRGGGSSRRQRFVIIENKGWLKLTQVKVQHEGAVTWTPLADIDLKRSQRIHIAATSSCLMKTSWTVDREYVFPFNTCANHRLIIQGAAAQSE